MIRVFPSLFSDPEQHDALWSGPVSPGETLLDAVQRLVPSYDPGRPADWQCKINGFPVEPSRYPIVVLSSDTAVDFYLRPRGDVIQDVLNVFTLGAFSLVMKFLTPKVSGSSGPGQQTDRDDMDQAAAKANTVRQGGVIREKFGEGRIYPDHLTQLRRYFVPGEPRRQAVDMFLSLGTGRFVKDPSRSKIGETPQAAMGANLEVTHYEPGADVSGQPIADNWYTSAEVGGTSGGAAGLDLTVVSDVVQNSTASTYVLGGSTVTIPLGAGAWPTGWAPNMLVRALAPYSWTVVDGGVGQRDRVSGPWAQIAPFVGMKLEVTGGFTGLFTVAAVVMAGPAIDYVTLDYSDGSPVTALQLGTFSLTVGYQGLRFRILSKTDQVITLERLTDTGATDGAWPGFDGLTTSQARFSLDGSTNQAGWIGPYAACPEGELTNLLELDFFYPAGLFISDQGNPIPHSVTVEAEYRDLTTAGAWTAVQFTHTSSINAQVGFSEQIAIPTFMEPEVQVRRVTIDYVEGNIADQVQWYGLKSKLKTRANSYADISTVAVRVFGGGFLAAQAEQMISFWVTRILPRRSGGAWISEGPTRSIRDAALYLAKQRGYGDNRLDLAEWDRLDAIWSARGDFFDGSFEKETTAEEALNVICRPGYAQVIAPRGILRPVRDALRTEAEKASARLYSPANGSGFKRRGQPVSPNDTDGVDVKYMDPVTWTTETVKCRLPGLPEPNKVTQLTLEGVNDRTRAWRLGMRQLADVRFRRWKNTGSIDMSAFASQYMDYCELQEPVPELSSGGLLRYWDGASLFVSNEPIPTDATHTAMRRPDGTKFGPVVFDRVDDYTFTLAGPLDFVPLTEADGGKVQTFLFFGTVTEMFWPVLMSNVTPSGQFGANIEALGYDERVYQFDDAEPPADA